MVYNEKYHVYVNKEGVIFQITKGNKKKKELPKLVVSTGRDSHGYVRVRTKLGEKQAHRIVWETFNGSIPDGMQVDHIDANKKNNALSNLQLLTPSENTKKAYLQGLVVWNKGVKGAQTAWNKGMRGNEYTMHYKNGFKNQFSGG